MESMNLAWLLRGMESVKLKPSLSTRREFIALSSLSKMAMVTLLPLFGMGLDLRSCRPQQHSLSFETATVHSCVPSLGKSITSMTLSGTPAVKKEKEGRSGKKREGTLAKG